VRLTEVKLKKLIEEVIEEGFFDLEDSPVLQKLGMVSKEEPKQISKAEEPEGPDIYESDDPWIQFMNACNKAMMETASRFSEGEDFAEMMRLLKPKFDLNNNGFVGDKGDALAIIVDEIKRNPTMKDDQRHRIERLLFQFGFLVEPYGQIGLRHPGPHHTLMPEYLLALSKYVEFSRPKGVSNLIEQAIKSNSAIIDVEAVKKRAAPKKQMTFPSDIDDEMKQMALDSDVAKAYDDVEGPIGYQGPMEFKFKCLFPWLSDLEETIFYQISFNIDLNERFKNIAKSSPLKPYGLKKKIIFRRDEKKNIPQTELQTRAYNVGKLVKKLSIRHSKLSDEIRLNRAVKKIIQPWDIKEHTFLEGLKSLEEILSRY
jgi:hypothetical protein